MAKEAFIAMPDSFAIKDCALLAIATGQRAQNLRELADKLSSVNAECIYYHFWGGLLRPHFDNPEYPNDFAAWAHSALHDHHLAERLGMITPSDFNTLEELRTEVIEIVEERLDEVEYVPWTKGNQQFHFIHSQIVIFDTKRRLQKPEELLDIFPLLSKGSIFYHFIDASRRLESKKDDFSAWMDNWGDDYSELIEQLSTVDPYFSSLSQLQENIIPILQEHLG